MDKDILQLVGLIFLVSAIIFIYIAPMEDTEGITGSVILDDNDYIEERIINNQNYSDDEYILEDNFSNIEDVHWGHMPLVYKYDLEFPCNS